MSLSLRLFLTALSATTLLSYFASSLELREPTVISIGDNGHFTISVEYCSFAVHHQTIELLTIVRENTRCYCFDPAQAAVLSNNVTILSQSHPTATLMSPSASASTPGSILNHTAKLAPKHSRFSFASSSSSSSDLICDIPGPTLVVHNGTSLDIELVNNLVGAAFDASPENPYGEDWRSWPSVTNLHTHGLHVSPDWDNIFVDISPNGGAKVFHYEIPAAHYPGTHWYHAHWHQSVSMQLQGGLLGALVVRVPGVNDASDPAYLPMLGHEKMLVFHYLFSYTTESCDCEKPIWELDALYTFGSGFWVVCSLCFDWCANAEALRAQSGFEYAVESNQADANTGRIDLPLVNGQFLPTVTIVAGEWHRLRLVNANGQFYTQLHWPTHNCEVHLMSNDGIFFKDGWRDISEFPYNSEMIIDPGSRANLAIKCDAPTVMPYDITFASYDSYYGLLPRFPDANVFFHLSVTAADTDADAAAIVDEKSPESKDSFLRKKNVPNTVDTDFETDAETEAEPNARNARVAEGEPYTIPEYPEYMFDSYTECPEIGDESCKYPVTNLCPCWTNGDEFETCYWYLGRFGTAINGMLFNASQPILYVCSDTIYEFSVNSFHPLHWHTSPFQVMQSLPEADNHFLAKAGDFRDTTTSFDDYFVRFATNSFLGPIPVHCHFLPHEDEGMMTYFQIVDCVETETDGKTKTKRVNMKDDSELNPFGYNPKKSGHISDPCTIFG